MSPRNRACLIALAALGWAAAAGAQDVPVAPDPPRAVPQDRTDRFTRFGIEIGNRNIRIGDVTVPRGDTIDGDLVVLSGDVVIRGRVDGSVVVADGDIRVEEGGSVTGDVTAADGTIHNAGTVGGSIRKIEADEGHPDLTFQFAPSGETTLASVLGMFVALAAMGFGVVYFLPDQLDILTGTVAGSTGPAFLAGLFLQPLLPAVILVGVVLLALTVVGILLIPFALAAVTVAMFAVGAAGYLAVARFIGGAVLTRRGAEPVTPYRSLVVGLAILMAVWVPAAVLGGIPVVGDVLFLLALVPTWVAITLGLGATVLSRAGLRESFARFRTPDHHPTLPTPLLSTGRYRE